VLTRRPVSLDPDAAVSIAVEMSCNPDSMGVRTHRPSAGLPDPSASTPDMDAGDPDVLTRRRYGNDLDDQRRRRRRLLLDVDDGRWCRSGFHDLNHGRRRWRPSAFNNARR
jgi:hypothetical protein